MAIAGLQEQLAVRKHELEERLEMVSKLISKNEQLANSSRIYRTRLEKFKKEGMANF